MATWEIVLILGSIFLSVCTISYVSYLYVIKSQRPVFNKHIDFGFLFRDVMYVKVEIREFIAPFALFFPFYILLTLTESLIANAIIILYIIIIVYRVFDKHELQLRVEKLRRTKDLDRSIKKISSNIESLQKIKTIAQEQLSELHEMEAKKTKILDDIITLSKKKEFLESTNKLTSDQLREVFDVKKRRNLLSKIIIYGFWPIVLNIAGIFIWTLLGNPGTETIRETFKSLASHFQ